ncbi:MAG: lamin tail domain-containing protein [Phycisphaerales bacterium]|nr:lamin tail domain-containing protein [Phycisphaerales bacterium]
MAAPRAMRTGLAATIIACVVLAASWPGRAQVIDGGNSPHENLQNRGSRSPGLLVRAGIDRHRSGPEITQSDPDPHYRLVLINELLQNVFAQLAGLVQIILRGDTDPIDGGGGGVNDVVITELSSNGDVAFVELFNRGALRIGLDGWVFADADDHVSDPLDFVRLERGETVVIQFGGDSRDDAAQVLSPFRLRSLSAGELALYDFSGLPDGSDPVENLDNADLMIDYLQWNDEDQERDPPLEAFAASASLWNRIDEILSPLADATFRLKASAEGRDSTGSDDFLTGPFNADTLGMPESQTGEVQTPPTDTGDDEITDTTGDGPKRRSILDDRR